mgnify:CR=1 FL=1|jgi:hypothetical protein
MGPSERLAGQHLPRTDPVTNNDAGVTSALGLAVHESQEF